MFFPQGGLSGRSSSIPGFFDIQTIRNEIFFRPSVPEGFDYSTSPRRLETWVPGDTIEIPARIQFSIPDNSPADIRVRYEFLVTVPEPSAALSIPLGAAWLAGLAAMKGGI